MSQSAGVRLSAKKHHSGWWTQQKHCYLILGHLDSWVIYYDDHKLKRRTHSSWWIHKNSTHLICDLLDLDIRAVRLSRSCLRSGCQLFSRVSVQTLLLCIKDHRVSRRSQRSRKNWYHSRVWFSFRFWVSYFLLFSLAWISVMKPGSAGGFGGVGEVTSQFVSGLGCWLLLHHIRTIVVLNWKVNFLQQMSRHFKALGLKLSTNVFHCNVDNFIQQLWFKVSDAVHQEVMRVHLSDVCEDLMFHTGENIADSVQNGLCNPDRCSGGGDPRSPAELWDHIYHHFLWAEQFGTGCLLLLLWHSHIQCWGV